MVVQGTNVSFLGGNPTCDGCMDGLTNVGTIRYAALGTGYDMNDGGTIVGTAFDDVPGFTRPATWTPGGNPGFLGDLGDPDADGGLGPVAINGAGQVVGSLRVPSGGMRHPVLWLAEVARCSMARNRSG